MNVPQFFENFFSVKMSSWVALKHTFSDDPIAQESCINLNRGALGIIGTGVFYRMPNFFENLDL